MENIDNSNNKIKRVKTLKSKDPNKKICRICKIEKDFSDLVFNEISKGGKPLMKNLCKECLKIKSKTY